MLTILAEDKIQIAMQNAVQILGVIKATFPEMSFDHQSTLRGCSQESSSLENLRCQWETAMELVGSDQHDADVQELHDDRLLALMQVVMQSSYGYLRQLRLPVPKDRTTDDEPHSQQLQPYPPSIGHGDCYCCSVNGACGVAASTSRVRIIRLAIHGLSFRLWGHDVRQ